ncbi:hypothetical protein EVAR_8391_1 [Eumeta japonica]|uniref:Peptidase aspartic putative domain-containing protein n=1 Tax=Eumeta variegata TaxID=151549 RepID=A0A4C1VCP8_EUMVA|nr:hypothetical protein EVAR_8391_1 [Eumeta japonica]
MLVLSEVALRHKSMSRPAPPRRAPARRRRWPGLSCTPDLDVSRCFEWQSKDRSFDLKPPTRARCQLGAASHRSRYCCDNLLDLQLNVLFEAQSEWFNPVQYNARNFAAFKFITETRRNGVKQERSGEEERSRSAIPTQDIIRSQIRAAKFRVLYCTVVRDKNETAKLRVVFDGSAKATMRKSLNGIQSIGLVGQDDLLSKHKAMTCSKLGSTDKDHLNNPDRAPLVLQYWRWENKMAPRKSRFITITEFTGLSFDNRIKFLREHHCYKTFPCYVPVAAPGKKSDGGVQVNTVRGRAHAEFPAKSGPAPATSNAPFALISRAKS